MGDFDWDPGLNLALPIPYSWGYLGSELANI